MWILLLVSACGPDADGGDAASVPRPGGVAEWTLSEEPLTDIGGGEDGLFVVTSAARTRDGIVVANAGTSELRWYDDAGRMTRTAGRRGGGPGEFRHIAWVGVLGGDSVAAWDPMQSRLTIFEADGRFGRSVAAPEVRSVLSTVAGRLGHGALVLTSPLDAGSEANGTWRDSIAILRFDIASGSVDTLGRAPGTEWVASRGGRGGERRESLPFGRATAVAAGPDGYYVGTADAYEIDAYGADGRLHRRIGRPHRPVRLGDEDRRAFAESLVQPGASPRERQETHGGWRTAPFAATLPPYARLTPDSAGNLWVQELARPSDADPASRWSVFDPQGRWIATVRGPPRARLLQAGSDWVLVDAVAPDDTERVRLYRVVGR